MITYILKSQNVSFSSRRNQKHTSTAAGLTDNATKAFQGKMLSAFASHSHQCQQATLLQAMADDYATRQPSVCEKPILRKALPVARQINAYTQPVRPSKPTAIHHDPALEQDTDAIIGEIFDIAGQHLTSLSPPLNRSSHLSVAQRKVYVNQEDKIVKKAPLDPKKPGYYQWLDKWITDPVFRHFMDDGEIFDHYEGHTDDIGSLRSQSLGKEIPWIRLPHDLWVVGEDHSRTTMIDLVKAVGTTRFLYEMFEGIPTHNGIPNLPGLSRRNNQKIRDAKQIMNLPEDDSIDHHLEDIFPKLLRGLLEIHESITEEQWKENQGRGDGAYDMGNMLAEAFGDGLTIAKDLYHAPSGEDSTDKEKALAAEWDRKSALWTNMMLFVNKGYKIGTIISFMTPDEVLCMTRLLIKYLLPHFSAKLDKQITEEDIPISKQILKTIDLGILKPGEAAMASEIPQRFTIAWPSYFNLTKAVNKLREDYMLHRIKTAKNNRYRLVGMGIEHMFRIANALKEQGVNYISMDDLIQHARGVANKIEGIAIPEDSGGRTTIQS